MGAWFFGIPRIWARSGVRRRRCAPPHPPARPRMVRAALLVTQGIIALHVAAEKHRRQMWTGRWWPGRESVYRHCQTNLLALVAQARDPARARLEVRRAVLPSGIRLTTWITVGVRRDPTTTPLIERGPPGFSSAGSAARHLPAYEHVYQRRQHPHLSAACAQDLPATTAEAGQTATPSFSPPVITSASPPTFKSPSSSPSL